MGRPSLLNPERHKAIVAAIRAGAYDWVAAQANGIDPATFRNWMLRGKKSRKGPYLAFLKDVLTARAQARLSAEIEVRKDLPFNWLRYGPGRERDNEPGWTESREIKHSGSLDVLHSTEWGRLAEVIDGALLPYPEARLAVANALRGLDGGDPKPRLLGEGEPLEIATSPNLANEGCNP